MFRYMLGGGDLLTYVISLLLTLPIVLLALSMHEAAHGAVAYRLGDPTARNFGRLTLNPAKHLDPMGFLCMLLAGFGWAKPVPINSRNFRKPRRDIALASLAGPVSNLLLSLVFLLLLRFVGYGALWYRAYPSQFTANMAFFAVLFLYYGVRMNLTLAIFNLLPVPPLDGSKILFSILPPRIYFKVAPYERQITLIVMILLLVGPLSTLIQWLTTFAMQGLFSLVGMAGFLL